MNLPNKISTIRIALIPLMVFFYLASFIPYSKIIALVILVIAACTDFIDGHIARKYNMITDLGKFLDPIADKILVMAALLLVVADGTIPQPFGVIVSCIILGRELIISAFRQIAATKNLVMAADKWGKIKTIVTDISLPALFLLAFLREFYSTPVYSMMSTGLKVFAIFNYILLGLATILTILSGINYIVKNKEVLRQKNDG